MAEAGACPERRELPKPPPREGKGAGAWRGRVQNGWSFRGRSLRKEKGREPRGGGTRKESAWVFGVSAGDRWDRQEREGARLTVSE